MTKVYTVNNFQSTRVPLHPQQKVCTCIRKYGKAIRVRSVFKVYIICSASIKRKNYDQKKKRYIKEASFTEKGNAIYYVRKTCAHFMSLNMLTYVYMQCSCTFSLHSCTNAAASWSQSFPTDDEWYIVGCNQRYSSFLYCSIHVFNFSHNSWGSSTRGTYQMKR